MVGDGREQQVGQLDGRRIPGNRRLEHTFGAVFVAHLDGATEPRLEPREWDTCCRQRLQIEARLGTGSIFGDSDRAMKQCERTSSTARQQEPTAVRCPPHAPARPR
jgi:hypothetical protein